MQTKQNSFYRPASTVLTNDGKMQLEGIFVLSMHQSKATEDMWSQNPKKCIYLKLAARCTLYVFCESAIEISPEISSTVNTIAEGMYHKSMKAKMDELKTQNRH